jgi:hypothetical protein
MNLRATNNGDGTMSFVFTDTSIKPEYIYPWDWVQKDGIAYVDAYWAITGHYQRHADAVAIGSEFGFHTGFSPVYGIIIGYHNQGVPWHDFNRWEQMTVNIEEEIRHSYPSDIEIIVDENGMTATWTQNFESGFSFDDIVVFGLDISFNFYGLAESEAVLYRNRIDIWLEMSDVMN